MRVSPLGCATALCLLLICSGCALRGDAQASASRDLRQQQFADQLLAQAREAEADGNQAKALRAWQMLAALRPGTLVDNEQARLRADIARASADALERARRAPRRSEARAVILQALANDPQNTALRDFLRR